MTEEPALGPTGFKSLLPSKEPTYTKHIFIRHRAELWRRRGGKGEKERGVGEERKCTVLNKAVTHGFQNQ